MRTSSLSALVALLLSLMLAPLAHAADPFENWAGFFIAGDHKAQSGADSEVFDNGRRDVAKAFVEAGLKRENTLHFSTRPQRYADTPEKPFATEPFALGDEMKKLTARARGGCVFFLTTHGAPDAVVLGDVMPGPAGLGRMITEACGDRPTVAILSACFSGNFLPALAGPNRIVLSAARHDRTSFGCGESDVYTFFDDCLLQELPVAGTFDVLATKVRACVQKRETELGMLPPSEPQMIIGIRFENAVKTYALTRSYKVQAGDTLEKISTAMYGKDGYGRTIFEANRGTIASLTAALPAGQMLKIPAP